MNHINNSKRTKFVFDLPVRLKGEETDASGRFSVEKTND